MDLVRSREPAPASSATLVAGDPELPTQADRRRRRRTWLTVLAGIPVGLAAFAAAFAVPHWLAARRFVASLDAPEPVATIADLEPPPSSIVTWWIVGHLVRGREDVLEIPGHRAVVTVRDARWRGASALHGWVEESYGPDGLPYLEVRIIDDRIEVLRADDWWEPLDALGPWLLPEELQTADEDGVHDVDSSPTRRASPAAGRH